MAHRILVVDDSWTVRHLLARVLGDAGYDVELALDGIDAWSRIQDEPPSLVVLDVNMPRMNGIELVELVRRDPALAGVSVLMLTTDRRPEVVRRGSELGVREWMNKPFQIDELVEAAERAMEAA